MVVPMPYRYTKNHNFEDYSSGRVFYASPGVPAFPVRLASEVFQRGLSRWQKAGGSGSCRIYDPTCGGGYWLAVLAFLHWESITSIFASDFENNSITLAKRNLSLLTKEGLDNRITEIEKLLETFNKDSHAAALESALRLRNALVANLDRHEISTHVFQANALNPLALRQGLGKTPIDLVLADVPYGWHSEWEGQPTYQGKTPVWQMLNALTEQVSTRTILAIAANKNQDVSHVAYRRLERFQIGKRRVVFLQLKPAH
jgi:hypothetical protein